MPLTQEFLDIMDELAISWKCPCNVNSNTIGKIETLQIKQLKKKYEDLETYLINEQPSHCPFFSFQSEIVQTVLRHLKKANVSENEQILNDNLDPVLTEAIIEFKSIFNSASSFFSQLAHEKRMAELNQQKT